MEDVVKLQKSKLGLGHLDMLTSMHYLANSYRRVGRQAVALSLTEEVVTIHKSKLGTDHPVTLNWISSLATRYSEVGRRAEALQLTKGGGGSSEEQARARSS